MAKLSCENCIHRMVCNNKEEYAIFLDETMREPFDLMPDFLDMHISCKYFRKDYPTPRNTSSYIQKEKHVAYEPSPSNRFLDSLMKGE